MADRSQPAQRPVYHASAYKPDNVRDYHDDYIQTLSFYATDVPVHAQVWIIEILYEKRATRSYSLTDRAVFRRNRPAAPP